MSSFCSVCNKAFSSAYQLKRHTKSHTGEKPFKCTVCLKAFSESSHLKVHTQIHSGQKPHECPYCSKCFIRNADLKSHIRVHTGEKPYVCDLCDRRFSRSHHLGAHMQTHGPVPGSAAAAAPPPAQPQQVHECTQCLKRFASKGGLTKHTQIHLTAAYGTRPFKCTLCPKTFTYSHGLSRHARTHYQTRLYYCHICPATTGTATKKRKSYISMQALTRHLHSHEPSVSCDLCNNAVFTTSQELRFHAETEHALELDKRLVKCASALRKVQVGGKEEDDGGSDTFLCTRCNAKFSGGLVALEHVTKCPTPPPPPPPNPPPTLALDAALLAACAATMQLD